MTYINNIAHIHNDIIKLAREKKEAQEMGPVPTPVSSTEKKERAKPPAPTATSPPKPRNPSKPPPLVEETSPIPGETIPTAKTFTETEVFPVVDIDPGTKSKAEASKSTKAPTSLGEEKPTEVDYKAQLKSFEDNPDNQPKGIGKAFSVFSKAKGIFGKVMRDYEFNRLNSFLHGQDKKFRPTMRTKQPTATENYIQQYKEMTGKPIFNRSQLNKDMKILNSMRGEIGDHVKAWYKLQHLKTGKVPTLDQEMINTIAEELRKQNKAKKRAAKADKEEV